MKKLFVLFDKKNLIVEVDAKTFKILNSVPVMGSGQEGIAIKDCSVYIAEDNTGSVVKANLGKLNLSQECK